VGRDHELAGDSTMHVLSSLRLCARVFESRDGHFL
jgi:hypothetical protein